MRAKTVVIVVALILLLIVVLQNTQVVTLRFLFWNLTMSRVILLPLVGLIGLILGYAACQLGKKPGKEKPPTLGSQA
jgi:putative membrane protein